MRSDGSLLRLRAALNLGFFKVDYYQILKRSWEIIKKERVLWIFGMVLAAFSSGGGGGGSSGSFDDFLEIFKQKEKIPPQTEEKVTQVLGAVVSDPKAFLLSIFTSIPLSFWIALGIGILLLILFNTILGIFLRNWAIGALFKLSSQTESQIGTFSLAKGSKIGRYTWKRLFLVSLVIKGGYVLGALFAFLFFGLLFILLPGILKIIPGLILILLTILVLVFLIITSLWEVFAEIVVVLEDYSFRRALSFSWQLTRAFFWEGVILGIIHQGIGCLTGCLTVFIYLFLAGSIFVGFLINQILGVILLILFGIPLLILFLIGILIAGILRAFTSCNWVIFYEEIKKKEKFPSTSIPLLPKREIGKVSFFTNKGNKRER